MAFKILKPEEIELLTAEQREHYERELEDYKQRVAFVEKLTELEKAEIRFHKPKLRPVNISGEVRLRSYVNPRRCRLSITCIQKQILPDCLSGRTNSSAFLSESVRPSILLEQKFGKNLERVFRLPSQVDGFGGYRQKQYALSTLHKPFIPDITFTKPKDIIPKPLQLINYTPCNVKNFESPEMKEVVLSKLSVPKIKAGFFVGPKISPIQYGVDIKAVSAVKSFKRPEHMVADLPKFPVPKIKAGFFAGPKVSPTQCGVDLKSVPAVKSFKKPEHILTNAADISIATVAVHTFCKPERNIPRFDIDIKADIEIRSYQKPGYGTVKLHKVPRASVSHARFRAPEKQEFRKVTATRPDVRTVPYKKMQGFEPKISVQMKVLPPVKRFKMPVLNQPS